MRRCRVRPTAGFTLIELLVVTALVVVLAGIGLATYSTSVTRSREAVLKEDLFQMRNAIDQYYADKSTYPPDLASLVSDGYLRRIPVDPFTESVATWQIELSEYDPRESSEYPGVFDVRSGAEGTAIDGSIYAEW